MTKDSIIKKLIPVLEASRQRIIFAYLFGSWAEGTAGPLSDIDIAIYVSEPDHFSFQDKLRFRAECCRALLRDDIDVIVLNQLKNLILSGEIVDKGIVFYDLDPETRFDYEVKVLHEVLDFRRQRERIMGG